MRKSIVALLILALAIVLFIPGSVLGQGGEPVIDDKNDAPVLDAIGDKAVDPGEVLEFQVTAYDPDFGKLFFSVENLPHGAHFDNGLFHWRPKGSMVGVYSNVAFSVSDGLLTDSETITITVGSPQTEYPDVTDHIGGSSWSTITTYSGNSGRYQGKSFTFDYDGDRVFEELGIRIHIVPDTSFYTCGASISVELIKSDMGIVWSFGKEWVTYELKCADYVPVAPGKSYYLVVDTFMTTSWEVEIAEIQV